jgi:DNA-binding LacI/PurR family transcriptional regulator
MKRVSIQDIADAAGVSITTVSHALNGKGRMPDETRARIQRTADELGYRASKRARALATGRSYTLLMQIGGVGVGMLPDFSFFVEQVNTASATALERGYGLVVVPPGAPPGAISQLEADGAIVVDPTGDELPFELGIPVVTVGRPPRGTGAAGWVDHDMHAATRMTLDHLAAAGYERPAIVATRPGQSYVDDTVEAYEQWCAEHSLRPIVARLAGLPTETAAVPVARKLLRRRRPPDAIHTTLDRAAVGVLSVARELRLRVPRDLALTAISDSPLLRAVDPPVTALDVRAAPMARAAVELLLSAIEDTDGRPRSVTVAASLVARGSSAR